MYWLSLYKLMFHCKFYCSSQDVRPAQHIRASEEHEPGGGADGQVLLHGGHDLHGLLRGVVQTER